ncbi:MAG TPA: PEGA domain-containing protein [Rectinemataceae bacterium]|nr:PEGA domain-containing protein [Rectinemataceae bacterium]
MKRILALAAALVALAAGAAFAQNKTSLNIICDELGAQVYINGHLAGSTTPNFSFLIPQGEVQIRVQKNGFRTFETVVRAGSYPITLNVRLRGPGPEERQPQWPQRQQPQWQQQPPPPPPPAPATVQQPQLFGYGNSLSINANVPGASVFINGNPAGTIPFSASIPGGSYTILVRAPGYADFSQNVLVNGPVQIYANLQAQGFQLGIDAPNAPGAQVIVNGSPVGQTPYTGIFPPGSYSITIRAPGFADYSSQLNLSGPQNLVATLVPAMSTWRLVLPDAMINRDLNGRHFEQIRLFIDGQVQSATSGLIGAGRHSLRLVSGGMAVESYIDVQPGRNYVFEPRLGIEIR